MERKNMSKVAQPAAPVKQGSSKLAAAGHGAPRERGIICDRDEILRLQSSEMPEIRRLFFALDGLSNPTYGHRFPPRMCAWDGSVADDGWPLGKPLGALSGLQVRLPCPWGAVWQRLWVRETWGVLTGNGMRIVYRADGDPPTGLDGKPIVGMRWASPATMPRMLQGKPVARFFFDVSKVRCDRLDNGTRWEWVLSLKRVSQEKGQ
jgi:hypothetical protein